MKSIIYKISLSVIALYTVSCKKLSDFGDINKNPNGSSEVLTSALITNIESGLGGIASNLTAGYFCQYFSEATYPGSSRYNLPQFNSTNIYYGALQDAQVIINKNTDPATMGLPSVSSAGSNRSQVAIAKILQSYVYWTITDRWGDMPYSQALKWVAILNPRYDSQLDIYKG